MEWCQNRSAMANLNGQDKLVYMGLNNDLSLREKADTARRASTAPPCQWDAEDRMVSVDSGSTATYKYNSLGQRVERFLTNGSWTFDYLFGVGGEELGLYNAGGATWFDQDVPMGRRILVMYGSPLRIVHANNLGTTTVVTDQTGTQLEDHLFYPWGQSWTGTGLGYDMRFAGMHQFESPELLYPTDFRKYNPALGRWMTPDPMGGDVTNPQSFNRYAYVLNNPTTLTDPSGLQHPYGQQYQQWRAHCLMDPGCHRWMSLGGWPSWMGYDPFDLINIPVVDSSQYGWNSFKGGAYGGPTMSWDTEAGKEVGTSMFTITAWWGPLILGDAFTLFTSLPQFLYAAPANPFAGHTISAPPPPPARSSLELWQKFGLALGCGAGLSAEKIRPTDYPQDAADSPPREPKLYGPLSNEPLNPGEPLTPRAIVGAGLPYAANSFGCSAVAREPGR